MRLGLRCFWFGLLALTAVYAQNNLSFMESLQGSAGDTLTVRLDLTHTDTVSSLQFDLLLPSMLEIQTASLQSSRLSDHMLQGSVLAGNVYRVLLFSSANTPLDGLSGEVLQFQVVVRNGTAGSYVMRLENTLLGGKDGASLGVQEPETGLFNLISAADLQANYSTLDFGATDSIHLLDTVLTLRNSGQTSLEIDSMTFAVGSLGYSVGTSGALSILSGSYYDLRVLLQANRTGNLRDTLILWSNDPDGALRIPLNALAYAVAPRLVFDVDSLFLDSAEIGSAASETFVVRNSGTGAGRVFLSSSLTECVLNRDSVDLEPGQSASVQVSVTGTADSVYQCAVIGSLSGQKDTIHVVAPVYEAYNNHLQLSEHSVTQGGFTWVDVGLLNNSMVAGLQFDLHLPDFAHWVTDSIALTSRTQGYTVTVNDLDSGVIRVMLYSGGNQVISASSGVVLRLGIQLGNGALGTYTTTTAHEVVATVAGKNVYTATDPGQLTVTAAAPRPSYGRSLDTLRLDTIQSGDTLLASITIVNSGNSDLILNHYGVGISALSILSGADTIAAGSSQGIVVQFAPTTAGNFKSSIFFSTNDENHPRDTIPVLGTASAPVSQLVLLPETLSFTSQLTATSSQQSFRIKNQGNGILRVTHIVSLDTALTVAVTTGSLAENQQLTVPVTFTGDVLRSIHSGLVVYSDAPSSPDTLAIVAESHAVNTLSLGSGSAYLDSVTCIGVNLQNSNGVSGVQFDLQYPYGAWAYESVHTAARAVDHAIVAAVLDSGWLRVVLWSGNNTLFSGDSGDVAQICLTSQSKKARTDSVLVIAGVLSSPQYSQNLYTGSVGGVLKAKVLAASEPLIVAEPASLQFDSTEYGDTIALNLTLRNQGTGDLILSGQHLITTEFATTQTYPYSVEADSSVTVVVRFQPGAFGLRKDTLKILSNDPSHDTLRIPLQGVGLQPTPAIAYSTDSLQFGSVTEGSLGQQTLTITNAGNHVLTVSGLATTDTAFSVSTSGFSLMPDKSKEITLTFTPDYSRSVSGALVVQHNASGSPDTVVLQGQSRTVNTLALSADTLHAGSSASAALILHNTSAVNGFQLDLELPEQVAIDSVRVGSRASDHLVQFTHLPNGTWRVLSWSASQAVYSGDSGCIATFYLSAGEKAFLQTASLLPTKGVLSADVNVNVLDSVLEQKLVIAAAHPALAPVMALSSDTLPVLSAPVGSYDEVVLEVYNQGGLDLVVDSITSALTVLSFSPDHFTVSSGDTQQVVVRLTPPMAFSMQGRFKLYSNASDQAVQTVWVSLQGLTPVPAIAVVEDTLDVGAVDVGVSGSATFHVYNPGYAPLSVSAIASTDASLGFSSSGFAVAAGDTFKVTVTALAHHLYTLRDSIVLTSDAGTIVLPVKGRYVSHNVLSVVGDTAQVGDTLEISVDLENKAGISGVQLTVNHPAGMVPLLSEVAKSSRLSDHVVSVSNVDSLRTRVLLYSPSNALVGGTSGHLVTFKALAKSVTAGAVPLEVADGVVGYAQSGNLLTGSVSGAVWIQAQNAPWTPHISTRDTVMFAQAQVGQTLYQTLRLYNTGSKTLEVSSMASVLTVFGADSSAFSILPQDSVDVPLWFKPNNPVDFQDRLLVTSNDPDRSVDTVILIGTGVKAAARLALGTDSLNFGQLAYPASKSLTFYVLNQGYAPLQVASVVSRDSAFGVSPSTFAVAAQDSLQVTVTFRPDIQRDIRKMLVITSQSGVDSLVLSASSQADNQLILTDLSGGSQMEFELPVVLKNDRNITGLQFDLTVPEGITLTSLDITDRRTDHVGSVNQIAKDRIRVFMYSSTNAALTGDSGVVARLHLFAGLPAGEYPIGIQNAVVSAANGVNVLSKVQGDTLSIGPAPDLRFLPTRLVMGYAAVGTSDTQTVQIYNAGTSSIHVTGIDASHSVFSVRDTSWTLAAGDTLDWNVVFTPTAKQIYEGLIRVHSNDSLYSEMSLPVRGSSIPVHFAPDSLHFALTKVGDHQSLNVKFTNFNLQAVTGTLASTVPQYQAPASITIPAQDSTTVTIRFSPTTPGNFRDTLRYVLGPDTLSILLSSSAFESQTALRVKKDTLDLGSVGYGLNAQVDFTLYNDGNQDLQVDSMVLSGTVFQVNPTSLMIGASSLVQITVTGSPMDTVAYTETLKIYSVDTTITVFLRIKGVNLAPVFVHQNDVNADEDALWSLSLSATDPNGDSHLRYSGLAQPASMQVDSVSGLVQWTPLNADSGAHALQFLVEDSLGARDTLLFTLNVHSVNDTPRVISVAAALALRDSLFVYHMKATDEESVPTLTAENLPSWLTVQGDSVVGTPGGLDGDTSFRVIADDGALSDTLIVKITVSGQISSVQIALRVALEGGWSGSQNGRANQDSLPLVSPYVSAPWKEPTPASLQSIPSTMAEWLYVELWSSQAGSADTLVAAESALLLADGSVSDVTGGHLRFDGVSAGSYFVRVRHRSHLDIWSNAALILAGAVVSLDLTDSSHVAGGSAVLVDLTQGVYGMCAGDLNADGFITAGDVTSIVGNLSSTSYVPEDLNRDGFVTVGDVTPLVNNLSTAEQRP